MYRFESGQFFFENERSLKPTRAVPLNKKIDNFVFNDCSFVRLIKGSKKKMEFNTKKTRASNLLAKRRSKC